MHFAPNLEYKKRHPKFASRNYQTAPGHSCSKPLSSKKSCNHVPVQGMSPTTAAHICSKAGLLPKSSAVDLSLDQWQAMHQTWLCWIQAVETSSFTPTVREDGAVSVIGAYSDPVPALQAVDVYYRMPQVAFSLPVYVAL